jgi:septal ring factor EnvC (AmiA/AmiB activator)
MKYFRILYHFSFLIFRFSFLFVWLFSAVVVAQQTSPKVKELEKQRKNLLDQIEVTARILSETKQTESNAIQRMQLISSQIDDRFRYISLLKEEVKVINGNLKSAELKILSLEKDLSSKKKKYAASMQKMQTNKKVQDKVLFVLSADNFSQLYRRLRYLKEYAVWQKIQAKEITSKQTELERQKTLLKQGKTNKLRLLKEEEIQQSILRKEEVAKQQEVAGLQKKEKALQIDLTKKKKRAEALNRQIEKAIADEIERVERERKVAEKKAKSQGKPISTSEKRVAETTGGYAMTKEERSLSVNFSNNKGALPFPLKGEYKIIGHFGTTKHQDLKYVTLSNNGIDIQTMPGTEARAVFSGVVTSVFVVPGYNNSVIIRHGNYLTVYSNLKEVYVKSGSKVSTGQAIGKIFTDSENGNSTILHFELWKEKVKLNPEGWLD